MTLRRAAVALTIAVVVATIVTAAPAAAHAELASTTPTNGAVLDAAPDSVVLTFTGSVDADDNAVQVFDADAARRPTGPVEQPDGRTVRVDVDELPAGVYIVSWKVVSADGHPISGAFSWTVRGDDTTASTLAPDAIVEVVAKVTDEVVDRTPVAVSVAYGVARGMVFGSLLLLVGGAGFVSAIWPSGRAERRVRRTLWASWAVLGLATAGGIVLQAADADLSVGDVLDTTFGRVWTARLALLVPAAVLLLRLRAAPRRWFRAAGAAVGLALLATPALSGHADSGRWQEVAKALDITHLAAGALWLGGVVVLLGAVLRRDHADRDEQRSVMGRFSPIAFGAVAVLVATGLGQSIRQVQTLDALETSYGRFLAVKVVLVLTLVGVASLTRSAVHGRLAVDVDELTVLRRLVAAELAIAVAVLGVTALLVDADPGHASAVEAAGPFNETVVVDDVLVNAVVVPGVVGPSDIHIYVDDPSGGLSPPLEATGTLSRPAGGSDEASFNEIDVPFFAAGPGHWSANDVAIPIAGEWELELEILLTDIDKVTATFSIPIGEASGER